MAGDLREGVAGQVQAGGGESPGVGTSSYRWTGGRTAAPRLTTLPGRGVNNPGHQALVHGAALHCADV